MKFYHGAALSVISHLSRILIGFLLLKLVSYYLGANGLGLLGNYMSAVTIVSLIAGGGIATGVIKYVAEFRNEPQKLLGFVSQAASFALLFSLCIMFLGVSCSPWLSNFLFGSPSYYPAVVVLSVAQMCFAFANIVGGVCNGLGDMKTYAKIQVVGNILAFPVTWFLISQLKLVGAIIALVVVFVLPSVPSFYFYRRSMFYKRLNFTDLSWAAVKRLSKFTMMVSVSAIVFPFVEIIVRNTIVSKSGYAEAGIWQGVNKISNAYVGFFSVFLANYFMPIVSAQSDKRVIRKKVYQFLPLIMAMYTSGAVFLYCYRSQLIPVLLSSEFNPLVSLIGYQLIGDFFKISSYVIGFVCVAKAATRLYIAAEFLQSGLFLFFVLVGLNQGNAEAVMQGYSIAYIIYFLIVFSVFHIWSRD